MFRTATLSIIRSFSLCTQHRFVDSLQADVQRNCLKYLEFYSKNKFEKLVHPVGFIIRIEQSLFVCLV